MAKIEYYSPEKVKAEFCKLVDENPLVYFEVKKIAEPRCITVLEVTARMFLNEDIEFHKNNMG